MSDIILIYVIAGIITGAWVSTMNIVEGEFRGHSVPFPRLLAALVFGALWPVTWWQWLSRPLE